MKHSKIDGVQYDINYRWENGIRHHAKSVDLYNRIEQLDFEFQSDFFCWKSGGDGDNGEALMYLLDIYFDEQDIGQMKTDDTVQALLNLDGKAARNTEGI
jgi:hypothetical protein